MREVSRKLPKKLKFAYAFGSMCLSNLVVFNTFFLLWFYTDVAKIPASVATVIMLIARVWDAVIDPVMGVMVDRTRSQEGRCRFWLKYFSVPAGVCVILSYMVPDLTKTGVILWVAITYILQGTAQSIVTVPMNTLLARLTEDREERVSVAQWRGFGSLLASTLVTGAALPLATFIGGGNSTKGFLGIAIICGVLYAVGLLLTVVMTKGYELSYEEEKERNIVKENEKFSLGKVAGALLQNKVCLLVCITNIIYLLYASTQGSTMVYYLQYNLKNTDLMGAYSVLTSLIGFAAVAGMGFLGRRFGNAKSCAIACVMLVVSYGVRFITQDQFTWVLFVCWGMEGIGTGLFGNMIYQCVIDSITYGKWKTGVDNQAVIMSVFTFFQKAGLALGGVVSSGLLAAFNYQANAVEQSATVKNLFFAEIVTAPALIFAVLFFLFLYVNVYEKKIPQMLADIREREQRAEV